MHEDSDWRHIGEQREVSDDEAQRIEREQQETSPEKVEKQRQVSEQESKRVEEEAKNED